MTSIRPADERALRWFQGFGPWAILCLLVGSITFARGFQGVFLYDDLRSIPSNPTIRSLTDFGAMLNPPPNTTVSGRPLVNVTLAINHAISGSQPWSYHLVNLLLHIGCGWLILWLLRQVLAKGLPSAGDRTIAMLSGIASLIWIVHPLHVETVVYVVQRTELLYAFFYLLTLAACWRYFENRRRSMIALAFVSSALGMMCKEAMATVPVMVLLIDWLCFPVPLGQRVKRHGWLYGALAASWLVLIWVNWNDPRGDTAGFDTGVSSWQYLMTQSQVLCHYLWNAVCPTRLAILYDWPLVEDATKAILPGLFILLLLGLTVGGLVRKRLWSLAGGWFFLLLAPTSSFIPISTEVAAERRMYLPLLSVVVPLVVGGGWLWQKLHSPEKGQGDVRAKVTMVPFLFGMGVVGFMGILGGASWHQTGYFAKQSSVFGKALAFEPEGPYLLMGQGLAYLEEKEPDKALASFALARQVKPDLLQGYFYAATVHLAHQRADEAIELCRQALNHEPKYAPAYMVLAQAAWQKGDREQATRQAQQALRYGASMAHVRLAVEQLLASMGKTSGLPAAITPENLDQVIDGYEVALRYSPNDPSLLADLAAALARKGMTDAAMKHLHQSLKQDPKLTRARLNLALLHLNKNEMPQAIREYESALRHDPDSAEAHYQLAVALARIGQIPSAIEHQRKAVTLQPDRVQARLHLALMLLSLSQPSATAEALVHAEQAVHLTQGRDAMANDVLATVHKQQSAKTNQP